MQLALLIVVLCSCIQGGRFMAVGEWGGGEGWNELLNWITMRMAQPNGRFLALTDIQQ